MFLFLGRSGPWQVRGGAPDPCVAYLRSPLDTVTLHSLFADDTRERHPCNPVFSVSPNYKVAELAVHPYPKLARVHTGPTTHALELMNETTLRAAVTAVTEGPIRDTDGGSPCK